MAKRKRHELIEPEKVLIAIPETQNDNPETIQNEEVTTELRPLLLKHGNYSGQGEG